ncbi:MAG: hypothetical protein R6V49_01905, partial [Bacteroidales bacterium]
MKIPVNKYIGKLIGRRNLLRLSGASAGSLLGFFILMAALQLWFDARWFMNNDEDDLFAPGIVVINKKISMLNTLGISGNTFSVGEIDELRAQHFVNRVEPFIPCHFKVAVSVGMAGVEIPNLVSEFFFESVPDDIVGLPEEEWAWSQETAIVPVVLPADFLKFYNFGFAPGQNLPQLSEKTLRMANLKIRISGNGESVVLQGRIVGLSEKINAILVPESFMQWANQKYGDQQSHKPTRLVIVSRVTADPELTAFIRERNYETSESELRSGKLNQLLQISLLVTAFIGLVIILLALYLFVLSFSLFIVRSDYEIRTLIQLGVPPGWVIRYLFTILCFVVLGLLVVDSLFLFFAHHYVSGYLLERGIGIMTQTAPATYIAACVIMLLLLIIPRTP